MGQLGVQLPEGHHTVSFGYAYKSQPQQYLRVCVAEGGKGDLRMRVCVGGGKAYEINDHSPYHNKANTPLPP
jgi:hypothetical protein